ncbi:hypothetical protein WJX82_004175 [Trebouxia sp. C0006]
MADDFERAVLFSFDQTGNVDAALKDRAVAYCNQTKAQPLSWQLCLEKYSSTAYMEVRFWCLQTLHEVLITRYDQLDSNVVKQAVLSWVRNTNVEHQMPPFLRNKVAQVIVALVQNEYPHKWPSFWTDLLGMLAEGPGVVDMFCRILIAIDDDVISLDIARTQEGIKRSMQLKDAMRETCLTDLSEAWYNLLTAYQSANPDLAAAVLNTVERYVNWIDVALVVNERFIPLLFTLLSSPSETLKGAAADVLTEIISKRMEPQNKLGLIQQLGLGRVCAQWGNGLPVQDGEYELATKYAKLLATIVTEVLDSCKKVENQLVSFAAVGVVMDEEAVQEATSTCQAADKLIQELLPAVLATLRDSEDEVATAVVPFLNSWVARLKANQKRTGGVPQEALHHMPAMLDSLAVCARFPQDSCNYPLTAQDATEAVAAEEETATVLEKRQDLFTLFKNTAKLVSEPTYVLVGKQLQGVVSRRKSEWQDVELAITLLYQLGEGAAEETLKPGSGTLGQLATGLFGAEVPAWHHRLVVSALLETYVRFSKVMQQNQEYIPNVLAVFLGDSGMGHPDEAVSTRACYLFSRLVKALRQNIRQFVREVLHSIQGHLVRIATHPPTDGGQAAAKAGGPGGAKITTMGAFLPATDDRLYAYEGVGVLLGQEELPAEEQHAYIAALLQPLIHQIETSLAAATTSPGAAAGRPAPTLLIQQALEAIARISKGFNANLCTRVRPEIGSLLITAVEAALRIPQQLPTSKPLRARFISFLHRMVECLANRMLPYLPTALQVLMHVTADCQDMCDVVALLNQLMLRFKTALQDLLKEALTVCLSRIHSMLTPDWDWSGRTSQPATAAASLSEADNSLAPASSGIEDLREKGELQKAFYGFLHAITVSNLSHILLQTPSDTLHRALTALVAGGAGHVDPGTRKTCLQVLHALMPVLCSSDSSQQMPGARQFAVQQIGGHVCLQGVFQGGVDVRDAASSTFLTEVAATLKDLQALCGNDFSAYLQSTAMPATELPNSTQEELVFHILQSEAKDLKAFIRLRLQQQAGISTSSKRSAKQA